MVSGAGAVLRQPVFVSDGMQTAVFRGFLPGLLEPMHRAFANTATEPFDGSGPFSGRRIVGYSVGAVDQYGSVAFDVTGPWR
ncbi:hypothetical protein B447_05053 [Thauera sp. 27]|nr:hypothetical protein B447_05053 [Thauera sp. 27]